MEIDGYLVRLPAHAYTHTHNAHEYTHTHCACIHTHTLRMHTHTHTLRMHTHTHCACTHTHTHTHLVGLPAHALSEDDELLAEGLVIPLQLHQLPVPPH